MVIAYGLMAVGNTKVKAEMTTKEKPADRQPRDYWSDDGQIFFTGGKGYGLTKELQTILLGCEADILEAFKTGKLKDYLKPIQRQVLTSILEYRKGVLADAGTVEVKRSRDVRSRLAGAVKRRAANIRQATARKRLPVHKT